jgi:NADH-quinone oxidoreductase subunit C
MNINVPVPEVYGGFFDQFGATWKSQVEKLKAKFGGAIEEVRMPREYPTDVPIVFVKKDSIIHVLEFLKSEVGMDYGFLADITATDEEINPRFEIVYNLLSHTNMARIRLKVRVNDGEEVPTATGLWDGANWAEREVWDMYGVRFSGHPDLRRILMDERWVGHPQRKDYPLRGYQLFPDAAPINPKLLED